MRHRSLPVIAAVALVLGCDANSRPLAPSSGERPTFDIYDGSLGGNPDFFFLPPVLPSPTAHEDYDAGKFNGGLASGRRDLRADWRQRVVHEHGEDV